MAFKFIFQFIKNKIRQQKDDIPELCTLGPVYDKKEHEVYYRLLCEALNNRECCNIAISGVYGSGKSSILIQYANQHPNKAIIVSLWSLAPFLSPDAGESLSPSCGAIMTESITNVIEREVLRQLLYCGDSSRVPFSRFNRVHPLQKGRLVLGSFLIALLSVCPIMLMHSEYWRELLPVSDRLLFFACVGLFFLLCFTSFIVLFPRIVSAVKSGGLSTSFASLTLEKGETSYFDKYLDEIVYFFEVNTFDTVIFEDLDRFEDPSAYMRLKDLNRILNRAPKIKQRHKRGIRFVYAVKDKIFDTSSLEQAVLLDATRGEEAEMPGSNRVKFFDVVIPVVPFLSPLNAPNIASRVFSDAPCGKDLSQALNVIAPHILDMRLLKEVRNEYCVMSRMLLSTDDGSGSDLGLSAVGILAMAAYKCVNSRDYDAMRQGKSTLDAVYEIHEKLIDDMISREWKKLDSIDDATDAKVKRRVQRQIARAVEEFRAYDFSDCWQFELRTADNGSGELVTFGSTVERILNNRLCSEMVHAGLIGRDFTLYVSTYPPEGHGRAINYLVHHVRCNRPYIGYRLEPDDSAELLARSAGADFSLRGFFNADFFRYVLKRDKDVAREIVRGIVREWRDDGQVFLEAMIREYSAEGDGAISSNLVSLLVEEWGGAFDYLFSTARISEVQYKAMANVAMGAMNPKLDYSFTQCAGYFKDNYQHLKALGRNWSKQEARVLMSLIRSCGIEFEDLGMLKHELRRLVIAERKYALTRKNIFYILPSRYQSVPPLEKIEKDYPKLFDCITQDCKTFIKYVNILEDNELLFKHANSVKLENLLKRLVGRDPDASVRSIVSCVFAIRRYVALRKES